MRCALYTFYTLFLINILIKNCVAENAGNNVYVAGFLNYLNSLPDQPWVYEDGILVNSEKTDGPDNEYRIEVSLKVSDVWNPKKFKLLKCWVTVEDNDLNGVVVKEGSHKCYEDLAKKRPEIEDVATATETVDETNSYTIQDDQPLKLDNEVQSDTAASSGEQFIAIRRDSPVKPCIGCASHVDVTAVGVDDLVALAIKHLDRHDPNSKHKLNKVLDVERQVQTVNGVRFILTLQVDYNNCTTIQTELCSGTTTCKISILEKPWLKLPNGAKFRAIVANNCTEEWLFDDNGEVVTTSETPVNDNDDIDVSPIVDFNMQQSTTETNDIGGISDDDIIKVIRKDELQSVLVKEKPFTEEQLRELQEQIIPDKEVIETTTVEAEINSETSDPAIIKEQVQIVQVTDAESEPKQTNKHENDIDNQYVKPPQLSEDKKHAIDELLGYFDKSGIDVNTDRNVEDPGRLKRSYNDELKIITLAEKYKNLKTKLSNAKYIFSLGETLVSYLNEMDMNIKTRQLDEVIEAEDEIDNNKHYFYIQIRLKIPCEKAVCEVRDTKIKICSSVIDASDKTGPQILNHICHDEDKSVTLHKEGIMPIPADDPILLKLIKESILKIEKETSKNALKVNKILNANVQKISGVATRISLELGTTNCTKNVPFVNRNLCVQNESLGSQLCDIFIHEKEWLKDKEIRYSCIDRPIGETFAYKFLGESSEEVKDSTVNELVQEALQYLELQSNENSKLKLIKITSASTQVIAGLLTNIQFVVGHTNCPNHIAVNDSACELVQDKPQRVCNVEVWNRPWLEDGKQLNVSCKDINSTTEYDVKLLSRSKRQVNEKKWLDAINQSQKENEQLIGGPTAQNVDNPEYLKLAEESMQKYLSSAGIKDKLKVLEVTHVTTQVVAGSKTRINFTITPETGSGERYDCYSEVWEKKWINFKEITVQCNKTDRNGRNKRQVKGGQKVQDPTNAKYLSLAEESMKKYLSSAGIKNKHKVLEVTHVTTQVVAGSKTRINFTITPETGSDERYDCYSEVWEKPWMNFKDITVQCNRADSNGRSKRQVLGGETIQDPNGQTYRNLAEESMQKYLGSAGIKDKHKVLEVTHVTTQVVAGSKTRINFTITPETGSDERYDCYSEVWEKPWMNFKDITVQCNRGDSIGRKKREVPGSLSNQDPKNQEYLSLAEESMQKYLSSAGIKDKHKVLEVTHVTTQVVAGSKTRINFTITPETGSDERYDCYSEVWEKPWMNFKDITVQCNRADSNGRSKRQVLGGETIQDSNGQTYRNLAEESMQKYLGSAGIKDKHKVLEVTHVTTQVVAGSKTRINFTITPETGSDERYDCYSEVWEKPWMNFKDITVQCNRADSNGRSKRQVLGGETIQDPNGQTYRNLAEESMQKYLGSAGIKDKHKVLEVTHVTTQVVAGSKTRINFTITPETGSDERYDCYSEVWEKPWMNFKDITVQCNRADSNGRSKRQVLGGKTIQDSNSQTYRNLAEESMQKYLGSAGIKDKHKVLEVTHVTTQVVAGSKTRINFTITPETGSDERYDCYSEVWEKPWMNFKDITVQCNRGDSIGRKKREVPGGLTNQDPKNQEYLSLAEESMQKYLSSAGVKDKHKVLEVTHVTTQVVAGSKTRINFTITPETGSGERYDCYSEVWEKPWMNFKDITVQCNRADNNKRSKRQVPGGLTNQDPKKQEYLSLAEESMQKYLSLEGIKDKHRVLEVTNVATQVVAGSLTHIDFVILPKDFGASTPIYCYAKVWEKTWLNWKNIDVECSRNKNTLHQSKINIIGDVQVSSNVETIEDKDDIKYQNLAEQSLKKYVDSTKSSNEYYVSKIIQVTSQAVAGKLTRIDFIISLFPSGGSKLLCRSMVYETPWLNSTNIDVNCTNMKQELSVDENNLISYLDELEQEQDTHDETYRVLAKNSLELFKNQTNNNDEIYELAEIERVTTRKDDIGTLIKINFKILSSFCPSDNTECDKLHFDVLHCVSLVREKSTTHIEVSCGKPRSAIKLNSPGAIETFDTKNEMARKYAEESLNQYFSNSDVIIYFKILSIDRVTVQNEEAIITRIDFTISPTNCLVNDKNLSKCIFRDKNIKIKCHSDVTERPWLTSNKDIDILCENVTDINKSLAQANEQILITGQDNYNENEISTESKAVEKDINAPEYKLLSIESIQRYQHQTTSKYAFKLNNIFRVTSEVDDAVTTIKIDFSTSPTECLVEEMDGLDKCKLQSPIKTLVCHSIIKQNTWAGPRDKDIEIICAERSTIPDFANRLDTALAATEEQHAQDEYYLSLAEESIKQYQVSKKSQYAFKIMRVNHVTRQKVNGVIYRIEFVASPSKCLIKDMPDPIARHCELQEPLVEFNCYGKVWIDSDSTMKHEINTNCAVVKQDKSYVRSKRQNTIDDDDLDEDTKYYYADLAMNNINMYADTKNLHKLISIHNVHTSTQMGTTIVKMYLETASTYCLKRDEGIDPVQCEEIEGLNHRLCFARFWPSPEDELIVKNVHVVCDDEDGFEKITGISITELIKRSISEIEKSKQIKYKLVHQGEPNVIPSLDSSVPVKLSFIVASTNCTKDVNLDKYRFDCYIVTSKPSRACHSFIWLKPGGKGIRFVRASCKAGGGTRKKRSIQIEPQNATAEEKMIQKMVADSLDKLEMASLHKFKQRLIQINSYSSKLTTGRITTIDFDVGYTACLKYEWVANITSCEFLEHLPRRHCVSNIRQRLWIDNGWRIEVECEDDETPLEAHVEFESAETAKLLANEALKHIEAKYPHPKKQKVVRIFSLEKQEVAGMHYRMKIEVGFTDCSALSIQDKCNLVNNAGLNKFCRVNIWIRPWTDHPANFRVTCDYQEGATADMYHLIQAEHLFYDFLAAHRPAYMNDHKEMKKRFEIFKSNIEKIHELNIRERGTARYAVTRFADLSYEEFSSKYLGLKPKLKDPNQIPFRQAEIPTGDLPPTFDWRTKGAVTDVKNQGSCGSCWAFSVTGNIEGQWKIHTGKLVSLSEQELVDCDKLDNGCNGGLPDNAYRSIEQLGGLETETEYPYEGADDKCVFNKTLSKVQISGAVNISSNETDMAKWLVKNGPISIGINANAMQFYVGGVSHPWKLLCNPTNLDHGVLIVGFGIKDYPLFNKKLPYWTIKNSWGAYWGEQGYYRVYRGDGSCGVNQMASSAVIDD